MGKLIAKRDILYGGKQYAPGDILPANNPRMVDAWLEHDSAFFAGGSAEGAGNAPTEESTQPPVGEITEGNGTAPAGEDALAAADEPLEGASDAEPARVQAAVAEPGITGTVNGSTVQDGSLVGKPDTVPGRQARGTKGRNGGAQKK